MSMIACDNAPMYGSNKQRYQGQLIKIEVI